MMNKRYFLTPEDRERQSEWISRTIRLEDVPPECRSRHRNSVSGGGSAEYSNYFKVIPGTEQGTVKVVDGADPSAILCGKTDCGDVISAVMPARQGRLYLVLQRDAATEKYDHSFCWESDLPSEDCGTLLIAERSGDGRITQRWTGGMVYWSERYFV